MDKLTHQLHLKPTPPLSREVTFTKIVRGCACRTLKIWLSLDQFLPNFPPISILFVEEKHPILAKLGAFYNNLPKIHPIYALWAPSSLMKTPDCYTKFCEKAPQKAGTYTYTMSMWEPPTLCATCWYTTEGVETSCGNVQWAVIHKINTPAVKWLQQIFHSGRMHFKSSSPLGLCCCRTLDPVLTWLDEDMKSAV